MGTDISGDIDHIHDRIKDNILDINRNLFTRTVDGEKKDWFTFVTQKDSYVAPHQSLWIMEYTKSYTGSDVSRKTYNAPFYRSDKIFKDIIRMRIAIDISSQENYLKFLKQSGASCQKISDGTFKCKLKDFEIDIIPETESAVGIQKIYMSLNKGVNRKVYKIGESSLVLDGEKGVWDFSKSI